MKTSKSTKVSTVKFPSPGLLSRETPGNPPGQLRPGVAFPGRHPKFQDGAWGGGVHSGGPQAGELHRDSFRVRPLGVTWRPPLPPGV